MIALLSCLMSTLSLVLLSDQGFELHLDGGEHCPGEIVLPI